MTTCWHFIQSLKTDSVERREACISLSVGSKPSPSVELFTVGKTKVTGSRTIACGFLQTRTVFIMINQAHWLQSVNIELDIPHHKNTPSVHTNQGTVGNKYSVSVKLITMIAQKGVEDSKKERLHRYHLIYPSSF